MSMTPQELKDAVPRGMLSFPLTDFDANDEFDAKACARRLEWLSAIRRPRCSWPGGAGEFFSLTPAEFSAVIATAVKVCGGKTPIIAGTGYGTRTAIEYAQEAERLGADGLLLMPPYLVEASQEGLRAHVTAICNATRARRHRLQSRQLPPRRRHHGAARGGLPEPDRLQGRRRRSRADRRDRAPRSATG